MNTKTWIIAGAVGALALAVAVGAAGAIAANRALSGDDSRAAHFSKAHEDFGPRRGFGGPGFFGQNRRFAHPRVLGGLDAAATYLGLSEEELHEALRDGKTLAEVAEDEGKSVAGLVDAMVAPAEERIDEAVEDGRLDEDRAAELKQRLEETMTELVEGELPGRRFGGPGFGFGHGWFGHDRRERGPRA